MKPDDYIKQAVRTESPNFYLENISPRYLHAVKGMATEVGELQDGTKRALFYGKPLDVVNIKEELGDLLWYIALACDTFGFSLEEIMQKNIEKLQERFPDKFTEERALNRDLGKEREVLEDKVDASA